MAKISTQNLRSLPDIQTLKKLMQSLAMLDTILSPDWELRYYSFNSQWNKDECMGSMRDGCGDDLFVLFKPQGCFIKGLAHESPMAESGLDPAEHYRGLPAEFASCVAEPAFSTDDVTFCLWRLSTADKWSRSEIKLPKSDDPDGSATLLALFDGKPKTYQSWAEDYYEQEVPLSSVRAIYAMTPLTQDLVASLNADSELTEMQEDLDEIGYPT